MRRIVIGSMIRSGSTWLYNAARLLSESAGYSTYAERAEYYRSDTPADIHVVLVHPWTPSFLPGAVLTCVRDCRDAVGSAIRLGRYPYSTYHTSGLQRIRPNIFKYIIEASMQWVPRADYTIRFEDWINDKEQHLWWVANTLFPRTSFDLQGIYEILEELPHDLSAPSNYGYESQDTHCTGVGVGGGKAVLQGEDYHRLTSEHKHWLRKFGYDTGNP